MVNGDRSVERKEPSDAPAFVDLHKDDDEVENPTGVSSVRSVPAPCVTALTGCPPAKVIDPREDPQLINQFPNLIVRPEDRDARKAFEQKYSILAGESIRFAELMRELLGARRRATPVTSLADARWQALHAFYAGTYDLSPETWERDRRLFAASLDAAKETIAHVLDEYFPVMLRQRLKMSSAISAERDPVELLCHCGASGTDIISRIRRFEARRQLTFAQIEFELRRNANDPETLDEDLTWFVRALDTSYFLPRRSDQVTVIADLEPANANRVVSFRLVKRNDPDARSIPTKTKAVIPLDVRFVPSRGTGHDIMVYFDARRKVHAPLKLIRKRMRHHETLSDICGVKLVFFEEQNELVEGVERLRRTIVRAPGSVSGEASNAQRAGILDPTNHHSSSEYRARKYDVRMKNRIFEIQFMYVKDYVNELVATGQENHPLYKLRTFLDLVFPVIFPTELFGLDWRDDALRQELWNLQLAKI